MSKEPEANENDIAIIGMALRFPGAKSPEEYWRNLKDGVESVRLLTDEELLAEGVSRETLRHPSYVKSGAFLDKMEHFDPEFFGFSPKEGAILDPQHRHFLEASWEALEAAGHPPERFDGPIGVFAGCGMGAYFMFNILTNPDLVRSVGLFLLRHTGNDKDFLATRVSYCLNLTGPSINVQTACSTSLVAVHLAGQSLLSGECDLALAGGVTIELPHRRGYHYQEGEILSPDGHCRAFDHRSQGTIFGSGAGVVVLRRLADALKDGDHIHAVIKGTAVNNDGAGKVGYLAPSVDGQAKAITEALAVADVDADSIGYVECHGTGTPVGDPIEVSALTQAFRQTSEQNAFCGIGSVKTNIGHLDTAAGVASLIKVALALENEALPPSLNWEAPNPNIDFSTTPFVVNHQLKAWKRGKSPRRAGVNSLGVGGTNAHAIVEEAPLRKPSSPSKRAFQLISLSGRNKGALDEQMKRLAAHLRAHPEQSLADVAYTLYQGRRAFDQRRVFACKDREEAIKILEENDQRRVYSHLAHSGKTSLVFMFPGGGAQYIHMGKDLYDSEPVYREHIDRGLELLKRKHGYDLVPVLFPSPEKAEWASKEFERPSVQLPAIFLVEHALARLWISRGQQPAALVGHSLGENTAACVAGVMSFEDCLGLVHLRGTLFETIPAGGMISVPLSAEALRPLLGEELDLACVNGPELSIASGPSAPLEALSKQLAERDVEAQRVKISIAAHSRMLAPMLEPFGAYLKSIKLSPPKIPFPSNLSGTWITDQEATDPEYWVRHLRNTVRFADCIKTLAQEPGRIFLEVGPGKTLGSLTRQNPAVKPTQAVVSSLRHPEEKVSDACFFVAVLGRLWAAGHPVPADTFFGGEQRRRVPLPTYAFQGQRYWIDPGKTLAVSEKPALNLEKNPSIDEWFYKPSWKRRPLDPEPPPMERSTWLVFLDDVGVGKRLVESLRGKGHEVITVRDGDAYYQIGENDFRLSPEHGRDGYDALVRDLVAAGKTPSRVVHLWLLAEDEIFRPGSSFFHRNQERGFYSLFFLAQALGDEGLKNALHITVVSNGMQQVHGEALLYPEMATVLGPVKVIPHELSGVSCSSVDLSLPHQEKKDGGAKTAWSFRELKELRESLLQAMGKSLEPIVEQLEVEVLSPPKSALIAYRGGERFEQVYEHASVPASSGALPARVRHGGTYLITGGLGGIGLTLARHLAQTAKAKLILLSRTPLPDRAQWQTWLDSHEPAHPTSAKILEVQRLEAEGAEVALIAADVTDVERMREGIQRARQRFGSIHGVVHAAGVVHDDLIQVKKQSDVENVFTPKVYGTQVIDQILTAQGIQPDFVVLFSSTSTAIAATGQVDYVAANCFMNAFAQSRSRPKVANGHSNGHGAAPTLTTAINWGVWNEVGMAAEAASLMGHGEKRRVLEEEKARHPLFGYKAQDGDTTWLTARYSPKMLWLLDEHRTRAGNALIPGTGFIELARAALAEIDERPPFEIRDLFFFRPLQVPDDETKEVRFKLVENEEGYSFEVQSRTKLDDGRAGWERHCQAKLLLHKLAPAQAVDLGAVDQRCQVHRTHENPAGIRSAQEDHLLFGPRWRVLQQAVYGADEALGRLELAERFASDLESYGLHPALMDLATGFAMQLIAGYQGATALWVPISYKSVRVRGKLPRKIRSWVRNHGKNAATGEFASFDVVITDERGQVLVEVEEFSIKRMAQAADGDFAVARKPSAAELEMEGGGDAEKRQLSPAELAFQHNLRQGIQPAEGMAALDRVLSAGLPQVLVSSMDLHALVKQADQAAEESSKGGGAGAESGTKFARPQLDSEYVAPKDDVERKLVEFWEELLGVDKVGVEDNFFSLGGHSLIAVRLFAKIKKTYSVDYPISVLFEAPTIDRCAAMIKEAMPKEAAPAAAEAKNGEAQQKTQAEPKHRTRYTHLVAMHPGKGGRKRPFFLVAGMFGNVLNLRHLAHLIGTDRQFYGLQARGLYGDHKPHEDFVEMAADYLAEVRTIQPEGPYLLGGFSGGGITAYEMAQQLRAAGEEVSLLVFLDTPLPTNEPLSARDKMTIHLQNLRQRGTGYVMDWARERYAWELHQRRKREEPEAQAKPYDFQSEVIEGAFYRALSRYQMKPYPGRVALFRPRLNPTHVLGPGRAINKDKRFIYHDNGWTPHVGAVEVFEVPGDHDSMVLEPNVRVLASRLRECIVRAERRDDGEAPRPSPAP